MRKKQTQQRIHENSLVHIGLSVSDRIFCNRANDENITLDGADYAFIVSAFFGVIFIPITLSHFYKKIK